MTAPRVSESISLEERCSLDFIRDLNPEAHEYVRKCINRLLAERAEMEARLEAVEIAHRNLARDFAEARRKFAREALEQWDAITNRGPNNYSCAADMALWLHSVADGKEST